MYDLYNQIMEGNLNQTDGLLMDMGSEVGLVLIAAFGIAVGFVAYKLIKRALNKA